MTIIWRMAAALGVAASVAVVNRHRRSPKPSADPWAGYRIVHIDPRQRTFFDALCPPGVRRTL